MGIEITHIDCPKEWEATDDFNSHRPALWLAITKTFWGDVVEFGSGAGSTELADKLCYELGRMFISVETNPEYFKFVTKYGTSIAEDKYINVIENNPYVFKRRSRVLFVDSAPGEERKVLIEKYKDDFDIIVCHDTEPGAEYVYGLSEILSTFKYRIDYTPEGNPHTTIVSNTIDITKWINQHSTSFSTVDEEKSMNH